MPKREPDLRPPSAAPLALAVNPDALRDLVRAVVTETLAQVDGARAKVPDRLCYSEQEAAQLLGLEAHQLRDERLRGRISASRIVGKRIRYLDSDLRGYLMSRRADAQQTG